MVRLERIAYEKLFNNKMLGRAREIGSPKNQNYFHEELMLRTWPLKFFNILIAPLVEKVI